MHQLLYVSQATHDIPASDLDDILRAGRVNNPTRNLSGILIHIDGGFLQVLEGARENVMDMYGKIAEDPRHSHPRVLMDRAVAARAFPDWSLGYEHLKGTKDEMAGMFGIVREAIAGHLSPGAGRVVATMLETYYRLEMAAHPPPIASKWQRIRPFPGMRHVPIAAAWRDWRPGPETAWGRSSGPSPKLAAFAAHSLELAEGPC